MKTEEFELSAESQPIEFALMVCDLVTDRGLNSADATSFELESSSGSFGISIELGERLNFTLVHDAKSKDFIGMVRVRSDQVSSQLMKTALILNSTMPDKQRFSMDRSGALQLRESWSVVGLDVINFSAGLRKLIELSYAAITNHETAAYPTYISGGIRG
jgi:hypothetical protein